jgi:hypothetical protein
MEGVGPGGWRNAPPVEEARLVAFPARGTARECDSFRDVRETREVVESILREREREREREGGRERARGNRLLTRVWKRINIVYTCCMLITAHVQGEMIVIQNAARDINKRNMIVLSFRSRIGCTILYLFTNTRYKTRTRFALGVEFRLFHARYRIS